MNNKKNNNKFSFLVAILCLGIFAGLLVTGVRNYEPEIQESPLQGVSSESSLKGYLGKGYAYVGSQNDSSDGEESSLDEQAQLLDDQEEKNQEEAETSPEVADDSQDTDTGSQGDAQEGEDGEAVNGSDGEQEDASKVSSVKSDGTEKSGENGKKKSEKKQEKSQKDDAEPTASPSPSAEVTATPEPTQEPEKEDIYPTIATDLKDGTTINASYYVFLVQATDQYGQSITSTSLDIYGNGERLSTQGERSSGVYAYRIDLKEGSNTVDIKATDEEGLVTTLPTFTLYKGDEDNQTPDGSITISIEAGTLGLGKILPATDIEIYQGEQLSSVVLRLLENNGFDWRNAGSATSGFYLKGIGRGGITNDASIPEDLMAHLTEVNCQMSQHDANWLGEFDFTMNSGWIYFVNGEYMNVGMSECFPDDGDEIRIRFTLYSGLDLGVGENSWGDW